MKIAYLYTVSHKQEDFLKCYLYLISLSLQILLKEFLKVAILEESKLVKTLNSCH